MPLLRRVKSKGVIYLTEENNRIVYNEVVSYIRNLIPVRNEYFQALEAYADEHHVPIIQPEVAQLMQTLILLHKPKRILEIGTAIGYSASIMAEYMESGEIVSIEIREDMHQLALQNVAKYPTKVQFDFRQGDALEVLHQIDGSFDLIFIDASKGHYLEFLDLCMGKLNLGGLIISDNILYKGMIANPELVERRKKTIVKRMRNYLSELNALDKLQTSIIPIGDGVALSYHTGGK